MKEAVITDTEGFYTGVTLVEDAVTGVLPLYVNEELVGYQVAIRPQEGLGLPRWNVENSVWIEGKSFDLEQYKSLKTNLLSDQCNQAVLDTFSSSALGSSHIYSFDYEAQMNFAGAKQAFQSHLLTTIDWNTRDAGVLNHTESQFNQLWLDGFVHKVSTIGKYRALKALVEAAANKNDVDLVVW